MAKRTTPPDTAAERLAVIETQLSSFMDTTAKRLDQFEATQKDMVQTIAKYTGFWGAVLLVGSVLGAIMTFFGDIIRRKIGLD
jgi:hypothetical protein